MTEMTEAAKARLARYMSQARGSLAGCPSIDVEDVLRDIQEHVDRETQESPGPVSDGRMQQVLSQLGSPEQWVAREELPWWRRLALTLRRGPEDWRLAYLSFGLFTAAMIALVVALTAPSHGMIVAHGSDNTIVRIPTHSSVDDVAAGVFVVLMAACARIDSGILRRPFAAVSSTRATGCCGRGWPGP